MSTPRHPLLDIMANRTRLSCPATQWKVPGQVLMEPAPYTRLVANLVMLKDCKVVTPYSGSSEEEWRRWRATTKDHYETTASGLEEVRQIIAHLAFGDSRPESSPPPGATLDQMFDHCEERLRRGIPEARGPFKPLDNNTLQQMMVFPMQHDPTMILKDKCEQLSREMGTGRTHYGGHEQVKSERILSHFLDPMATQNLVGPYPPGAGAAPLTPAENAWHYATAPPAFMQRPSRDSFGTVLVWKTYDREKVLQMSLQLDIPMLARQFTYGRFIIHRHSGLKWHLDTPYVQMSMLPNPMLPLDAHMELLTHHMASSHMKIDDRLSLASQAYRAAIRKQFKLVAAITREAFNKPTLDIPHTRTEEHILLARRYDQVMDTLRTELTNNAKLQKELQGLSTKTMKMQREMKDNETTISDITKAFNHEYTKRAELSTKLAEALTKLTTSQSENIELREQLKSKEKEFQQMAELLSQQPSHQNMPPQVQNHRGLQPKRKREHSHEYTRVTVTRIHPLTGNNDPPLPTKRVRPNPRPLSPIRHAAERNDVNTSIDTQAPTEPATSPIRLPSSSPRRPPRQMSTYSNDSIRTWPTLPDVRGEDYNDDIPSLGDPYETIPPPASPTQNQ